MSSQAYLGNIQAKTGRTPAQFAAEARRRGLTEHGELIRWPEKEVGAGQRLFEHLANTPVVLGNPTVVTGAGVTHLRYPVHTS